ncbi:ATP-grasp domain-containing protein [Ramlibacter sp. WS9]|uniref:ATP-grasp domain-containing protein n=1 Tax=Ramlibacter sp. WS9 TaxID=1882741 RepID=UPI001305370A|nr:ATP-grasp domain-containing protein [Ramlibacter sp. WS9]
MRLSQVACYHGPNIWSKEPVLVCSLEMTPAYAAHFVTGAARLARAFPYWIDSSLLTAAGTPPGEIVARAVARWALGALIEVRGYLHEADARNGPGGATVWVGFHHPRLTGMALELAVNALALASSNENFSAELMKADLDDLWKHCSQLHPDYQARILMIASRRQDIPVQAFLSGTRYRQYGWGARSRVFRESMSNADGYLADDLTRNKPLSKSVFAALGMPTPRHVVVTDAAQLGDAASEIGYPCVVKPHNMGGGRGVTAGIRTAAQLQQAYQFARQVTAGPLMVEQFVPGDEHRLMVVGGKMVAAIRRESSAVVGDGKSTIAQLIDQLNADRPRNLNRSRYRLLIKIDDGLRGHLASQGADIDSVLAEGRRMVLRGTSNMSTGGVTVDVTDRVHPAVVSLAEQLALTVGLGTAGLDYLTSDISRSPLEGGGGFIEMNTVPGIDIPVAAGWTEEKIGSLVLGGIPGRIPVELCISPSLNLEAARQAMGEPQSGPTAAWVCGPELHIGALQLRLAEAAPWAALRGALRNKAVTSVRIAATVDEILAHGLPLDRFDRIVLAGVTFPERWQAVIEHAAISVDCRDFELHEGRPEK